MSLMAYLYFGEQEARLAGGGKMPDAKTTGRRNRPERATATRAAQASSSACSSHRPNSSARARPPTP
jgi:hypothetical protein